MNFFENIVYGIYTWDRGRGYTITNAAVHSKVVLSVLVMSVTICIYKICEFVSRKGIYFNKHFLFDKKADWAVLLISSFIFSLLITSSKKWEAAHDDERYSLISPVGIGMIILGAMVLSSVLEQS